ncbi:hypothetical protein EKO27_g5978 [Xylaria grammica]|uniref:Uncharacterized protein n=1 Tax=Xylaria grammica TaxID=363999 RepID=A0A439D3Y6_9PEZI|nr:hypothetical protein EKO27_g5978 [Xylaria grammica]GAW11532.1 hypothetical protein ANO14919_008790 [Xylariales sp. No.14919]
MSSISNQDAHQGGDLYDMAKDGTKIPNDAGKMNTIPSKANPQTASNDLGHASLNTAADNPAGSQPVDDDAITASGHSIPSSAFSKPSGTGGK